MYIDVQTSRVFNVHCLRTKQLGQLKSPLSGDFNTLRDNEHLFLDLKKKHIQR